MSSLNKKRMIGLVSVLVIIAIPIVFFQLLGGNLLSIDGANKRVIAIVNEDLGDSKDQEAIEMGREVVTILAEDSPYEWKVMGRGSAESGLKSNQYEGILYIPSDFSENIMSYDENNPTKAEFSYRVHPQKTGTRREKVLTEIDEATTRVNQKISTLYWSYIAQEMDYIKDEFESILTKETEFLTTMSSYYEPNAQTLAEEMSQQKEQLEGLRATIGETNQAHDERIQNVDSFGDKLTEFVLYIEQYKGFQEKQKEILIEVQGSSLEKIQTAAVTQENKFYESIEALAENNEKVGQEIQKVNEQIDENQEQFDLLTELRKKQVSRQLDELLVVQGTAIDRYNETILGNLEKEIAKDKKGSNSSISSHMDGLPTIENLEQVNKDLAAIKQEKVERTYPNLTEEQSKMKNILSGIVALKEEVKVTDPTSEFLTELTQLEQGLLTATEEIATKEQAIIAVGEKDVADYSTAATEYGNLVDHYKTVNEEYSHVYHILKSYPADTGRLLLEIREKESTLLAHESLTEEKKKRLQEIFNLGASSHETTSLLAYFSALQQFEFTLNEHAKGKYRDDVLEDEILKNLLRNVVEINEEESLVWGHVGEGLPNTQLGVNDLSTTFAAIMSGFGASIEEQHSALSTELSAIDTEANRLLSQIHDPSTMIASGEPIPTVGETEVLSGQQNVGSQLVSLSNLMNTLSARHDGLVTYANDLHSKANDIRDNSNTFSDKWNTNVTAMDAFNLDIKDFLSNTYVDGQENGYVFNHLVNPLEVKSESTTKNEAKKAPPVMLFIILLISSLLIGYFTYQYRLGAFGTQLGLLGVLTLIVGLIISLYSVNIYILRDGRAIEWSVFTVLLLFASASLIWVALKFGQTIGWLASMILMGLYISPLMILGVPEMKMPDFLSTVYLSIKYEPDTQFVWAIVIIVVISSMLLLTSFLLGKKKVSETSTLDESYEG